MLFGTNSQFLAVFVHGGGCARSAATIVLGRAGSECLAADESALWGQHISSLGSTYQKGYRESRSKGVPLASGEALWTSTLVDHV